MNNEKVKLIIHNMELLLTSLKEELNSSPIDQTNFYGLSDYDEVYDGD
jgi:hypothetical protein